MAALGERQEEFGSSLQRKGKTQAEAGAEDQRKRGEQPVAPEIVDLDLAQGTIARRLRLRPPPVFSHASSLPVNRFFLRELQPPRHPAVFAEKCACRLSPFEADC